MKILKWFKENSFLLILSIITITGSLIYYDNSGINSDNFYFLFFLYIGFFSLAGTFPNNKVLNIIKSIIYVPFIILLIIKPFMGFLFSVLIGLFMPLAAITLLFFHFPEEVLNINLLSSTKVYLILTIWTIIISSYGEYFMRQAILMQEYNKEKEKQLSQIEFNKSIINNSVIKYLLFSSYFLILIAFSIIKLNNFKVFENDDLYLSVNLSFVTFLAFDRLKTNKNLFQLIPKTIIQNLNKVWKNEIIGIKKSKEEIKKNTTTPYKTNS